jgi:gliding motility-associated-like protein
MNLLTNGSFESGNFNGWDFHYGTAQQKSSGLSVDYNTVQSNHPSPQIVGPTYNFPGLSHVFNSSDGSKMVLINDLVGGLHATCLHQTVILPSDFSGDCGFVSFNWTAILVGSDHVEKERPRFVFDVNYKKNGTWANLTDSKFYAPEVQGTDWLDISAASAQNSIWMKQSQEVRSLAGLLPGDEVRIRFIAIDCPYSQHGGAALIDNVILSSGCDGTPKVISYDDPLPNVFTPNGDGVNDVWGIINLVNACSIEFELFDRWGDRIFYHRQICVSGLWQPFAGIWNGKIRTKRRKIGSGLRKRYYSRDVRYKDTNSGVLYYVLKLNNCDQSLEIPGFFHIFL